MLDSKELKELKEMIKNGEPFKKGNHVYEVNQKIGEQYFTTSVVCDNLIQDIYVISLPNVNQILIQNNYEKALKFLFDLIKHNEK